MTSICRFLENIFYRSNTQQFLVDISCTVANTEGLHFIRGVFDYLQVLKLSTPSHVDLDEVVLNILPEMRGYEDIVNKVKPSNLFIHINVSI